MFVDTKALLSIPQKSLKCKTLYLRHFMIIEFYNILWPLCLVSPLERSIATFYEDFLWV